MKEPLKENLADAIRFYKEKLYIKLLKKPFVFFNFLISDSLKKSSRKTAKLFWGDTMNVVLPEHVSSHIYKYGYFDEEVCFYLISLLEPGDSFMDIGSHFGFFSILAGYLVGKSGNIVSVDPTPSTVSILKENIQNRNTGHFQIFQNAAFSHDTTLSFFDFGVEKSAYNSLIGSRLEKMDEATLNQYRINVEAKTGDSLVEASKINSLKLIKIDAESSEMQVMEGLQETLKKFHPSVILEIGDTGSVETSASLTLIHYLQNQGYKPYEYNGKDIVEHQILDNYDQKLLKCYNLLFQYKA